MRILVSHLISAGIAALIWIVVNLATGSTVLFAAWGLVIGVVVFVVVGYGFRRLVLERRPAGT